MLVGILSDTHDRIDNAIAGMNLLRQAGAQHYLHCGDVGGEQILDLLVGLPAALVWGNNDWDRRELTRYAQNLGITVFQNRGDIELDGKRFAIAHGDDAQIVRQVLDRQEHDYLLVGHSHMKADHRFGRIRMINPGALHRATTKSVAILNTASDELKFLNI